MSRFLKVLVFVGFISQVGVANSNFPNVSPQSDEEDIIEQYSQYLSFAVNIGKEVDAASTNRLVKIFSALKRRNPRYAASFLKGLRFEMIQKTELMTMPSNRLTTRTPEMRQFVAKYIREWAREADEYLLRSYAVRLTKAE